MKVPIHARVRVIEDVAGCDLTVGDVGIVCSTWHMPEEVYEVEFTCHSSGETKRALLKREQTRLVEDDDGSDSREDECDRLEDEIVLSF